MNTLLYLLLSLNMTVTTPANHQGVIVRKAGASCLVYDAKAKEFYTYNRTQLK